MKKTLRIALILVTLTMFVIPVHGAQRYSDLPDTHWAFSCIEDLSQKGLISGYPDGSFRPEKEVTYGEFIKLLYVGRTGQTLVQDDEHWALNYYNELAASGVYTLADIGMNDLDKVMPRMDMALMIGNILKQNSYTAETAVLNPFYDVSIYTPHISEIILCCSAGIINGFPDGSFRPYSGLTRAESVKVISGLEKIIPGSEFEKYEFIGVETVKNRDFRVTNYKVSDGFRGIRKIQYDKNSGLISVFSENEDTVSLFIDGYMAEPIINSDGDFTIIDGCRVFFFLAGDFFRDGSKMGISFDENIEEVFYYE